MSDSPSTLNKLFGSGPAGVLISIVLFFIMSCINDRIGLPKISNNQFVLNLIFIVSIIITILIIVWSSKSLPATDRGNKLCTTGAFKYFRHPLYAAFLSVFDFGLAFFLNSYIFLIWALLLHPVWHIVIRYEENLMIGIFGEEYREYQKKTGRFFPKIWR